MNAAKNELKFLGKVESFSQYGQTISLSIGVSTLNILVLTSSIIRVRLAPQGPFKPGRSWEVTKPDDTWPRTSFEVEDENDTITISTSRVKVQIQKSNCRLSFLDSSQKVVCEDAEKGGAYYSADGVVGLVKKTPLNEHFYGFGERTSLLNKRGRVYSNWTRDPVDTDLDHGPGADNLYQSIPFFIALQPQKGGYGLYLNNTYRSVFDMDSTRQGTYTITAEGGELDYYFIYGPGPAAILTGYTEITGRAALPPLWSLGYQQCRWSYESEAVVYELVRQFRERRIPADTLVLDIDYMDGYRVFTWDQNRFPDPKKMNEALSRQGFKLITIIDPGVKYDPDGNYNVFKEAAQKNYFICKPDGDLFTGYVWPGLSAFPDFAKAEVRQWWGDLHQILLESGVRGIWNDMNEPAISTTPFGEPGPHQDPPLDAPQGVQEEQTTHAEVHNLYGQLMSRSTYEGLVRLRPNERPFVLTRSGFAGIQSYAAVWMGDNTAVWEHLEMSMPQLCGMGLSGVSFVGVDIGGFWNCGSAELFARWIQLGAFYPFCRAHSALKTPQKEPWVWGEEVEAISRKYLELRYRFLPYIYNAFKETSTTGAPVFRPLLFQFWQDPAVLEINDQVLVGANLMLAPVYRPGVLSRSVYLPAGGWYDWWSGKNYQSEQGQYILQSAPLDLLPLYIKAGSVVPLGPVLQYTGEKALSPLSLEIYLDKAGKAAGELYEDDGLSFEYRQGQSCTTRYTASTDRSGKTKVTARREGIFQPSTRKVEINLHVSEGLTVTSTLEMDAGNWELEMS